jgi:hypothetical protein
MPQHRFVLRPVLSPTGEAEVLMVTSCGLWCLLPRQGTMPAASNYLHYWRRTLWQPAHTSRLFRFVGWNTRNVAVARLQRGTMVLTVVEDTV